MKTNIIQKELKRVFCDYKNFECLLKIKKLVSGSNHCGYRVFVLISTPLILNSVSKVMSSALP